MWKSQRADAFLVLFPRIQGPPPGLEKEETLTFLDGILHCFLLGGDRRLFWRVHWWSRSLGPGASATSHAPKHNSLPQALVVMVEGLAVFWLRCACCRCASLQSCLVCPPSKCPSVRRRRGCSLPPCSRHWLCHPSSLLKHGSIVDYPKKAPGNGFRF